MIWKFCTLLLLNLMPFQIFAQMNFAPSKSISIDGLNINYKEVGYGSKNIVFLHGFGLSADSWDDIVNGLDTNQYRMICFDIPGFGFSDNPVEIDYSVEQQTQRIYSCLKLLKIDSVTLIGHSYGGLIVLNLNYLVITSQIPLLIEREVLIDVPAFLESKPRFIDILENDFLSFLSLKVLPVPALSRFILKRTFYDFKEAKRKHLSRYVFFLQRDNIDESMSKIGKQVIPNQTNEITQTYPLISFPVLIIWGENDHLVKLEYGKRLHNEIKTSQFHIIEKCGHVPQEEKPKETLDVIKLFLNTEYK